MITNYNYETIIHLLITIFNITLIFFVNAIFLCRLLYIFVQACHYAKTVKKFRGVGDPALEPPRTRGARKSAARKSASAQGSKGSLWSACQLGMTQLGQLLPYSQATINLKMRF
jgi:hypothetical protein